MRNKPTETSPRQSSNGRLLALMQPSIACGICRLIDINALLSASVMRKFGWDLWLARWLERLAQE